MILYSPVEPAEVRKIIGDKAKPHSLPEKYGADFLILGHGLWVAVQRKTIPDLLASLEDGRLARETAMLKRVDVPVLIVEGRPEFTGDGHLIHAYQSQYTKEQIRNLLRSIYHEGILVEHTDSTEDTVAAVFEMEKYYSKSVHRSLATRPKTAAKTDWGTRYDRDWAIFLLQGFPGVGPVLAAAIFDHFGEVPLAWTCRKKDLEKVEGIGRRRVEILWNALKKGEED
ncbi:MAG: ERCC4 domain-containing protein [Desulfomonilaceae bacterium]